MSFVQTIMESEIGPLYLVASPKGLAGIHWRKREIPHADPMTDEGPAVEILRSAARQLEEYFSGTRFSFDLPLELEGTEFQKSVWRSLAQIPYGQTVSYRDIAISIGNKGAVRAVGSANGKNPVSILVPCHRVIASDGTLGGYGGGLSIKSYLLQLEKKSGGAPVKMHPALDLRALTA